MTWRSFDAAGKDRKDTSPCSLVPKMEVRNTDVSSMDTAMDTGIPPPLKQPYKVLSTSKIRYRSMLFGEYSQCCPSTMSSSHKVQVYIAFVSSLRGNILYIIVNHCAMKILEYFEYGNGPAKTI